MISIAGKIGCTPETLRCWVRQAEVDEGLRPGLTSEERARLKELEREVRELRRANEILKSASLFFATELDGRMRRRPFTSIGSVIVSGSSRSAVCCSSPHVPTTPRKRGRRRPGPFVTQS